MVSQYFPPEIGATQTRMRSFAAAAARAGHRVTVITEFPNHPHGRIPVAYRGRVFSREEMDGFAVERVWVRASPVKTPASRMLFYLSFLAMAVLRGALLRGPVDVVLATSPPLPVGLAGRLIAWRHRARYVLDIRDLWPAAAEALGELRQPLLLRLASSLEGFLYEHADRITTVTRRFVDVIARRVRGRRQVVHLPNGALLDIFDPARADPALRSSLGWDGRFVVTFAGNLGIAQGLASVIDAAGLLATRPVTFCFIGDGPAKARLGSLASERALGNVAFLPAVPTAAVTPYLLASDALLVALSRDPVFEMFVPSKLFDMLACARPVILMARGESREVLDRSGGGVSVDPEDAGALASAVERLIALGPDGRAELGTRGRAHVRANYDRAVQDRRLVELLEEVAATG